MINEKQSYKNAGVKLGDFGAIMSETPINGKWQVIFSEFYTGKDIADILVDESDLKVHESIPKDRYPQKWYKYISYKKNKAGFIMQFLNLLHTNLPCFFVL